VICIEALGKANCQGDSGGPLVTLENGELRGVSSTVTGKDCSGYGSYTDVFLYMESIRKHLGSPGSPATQTPGFSTPVSPATQTPGFSTDPTLGTTNSVEGSTPESTIAPNNSTSSPIWSRESFILAGGIFGFCSVILGAVWCSMRGKSRSQKDASASGARKDASAGNLARSTIVKTVNIPPNIRRAVGDGAKNKARSLSSTQKRDKTTQVRKESRRK